MTSFNISFLIIAFLTVSQFWGVASAPANISYLGNEARGILSRAAPAAPHWAIYSDKWIGETPPATSLLAGYNVFILAFYLISGPADNALQWTQLSASQRSSIKAEYAAAGISLIVSVFGSTDQPTTSGVDPVGIADNIANWVIQYDLDGVDIDYEDFTAFNGNGGTAEPWLISLTKELRVKLPVGQYILTHAPIAAWFPSALWSGGGYLAIDQTVGNLIDWYNLQFYSQNPDQYVTCDGLLNKATQYPGSALFEIAASGVSLDKLVIGKPATSGDASDYMYPSTLATCLQTAKTKGWTAGVMVWQYPDAGSAWITTARSLSWPVSGSPPSSSSSITTTTTSTTPSSGPTAGSCAAVAAWSSSTAYVGGDQVTYSGDLWTAKWWTEADVPGGAAGVWVDNGPCTSSNVKLKS